MIKFFKNKIFISYIILFIVTIIISMPLMNPDFDIKQGDGILHISRLMGTYQAILEGQKFPNIMYNFCDGFGYCWNIFYSPLTAFLPLIFKIFIHSFSGCLKIFMICTIFISGITMYKFTKETTKSNKIGVISGILYITVPYKLTNMYLRVAIGELTAFNFFPLIFLGINNIINKVNRRDYYFSIGAIGLIFTHNISTLIIVLLGFIYLLFNIKKIDKIVIKKLCINFLFIISITCVFWAPMIEAISKVQYEVFIPDRMGSIESLSRNGIDFRQIFYTNTKDSLIFNIGILNLIILLSSLYCFKKVKKEYKYIYCIFLSLGVLSIIMATKYFPWRIMPSIFGMIQFPWRFIGISIFFIGFVCSINISILIKDIRMWHIVLIIFAQVFYLAIIFVPKLKYDLDFNENNYWYGDKMVLDKEVINSACASYEYLPSKAQDNREYVLNRDRYKALIYSGNANVDIQFKSGTHMNIYVLDIKEDTVIEFPYIYYPGYRIKMIANNETRILDEFETDNGFVGISVPKNNIAFLEVKYEGTNIMKVSKIISIISMLIYLNYIIKNYNYN